MAKNVYKEKCFSLEFQLGNCNYELGTFKRWDGINDEKF